MQYSSYFTVLLSTLLRGLIIQLHAVLQINSRTRPPAFYPASIGQADHRCERQPDATDFRVIPAGRSSCFKDKDIACSSPSTLHYMQIYITNFAHVKSCDILHVLSLRHVIIVY